MLDYRPLVYFWIAEYNDGSAFPQFDPQTGSENRFGDVDLSKLKRFGWYPFNDELARKIFHKEGIHVICSANPIHRIETKNGQKLIAHRTNTIKLHSKSGVVERGESVYVLGVEGGKILRIYEDGSVE